MAKLLYLRLTFDIVEIVCHATRHQQGKLDGRVAQSNKSFDQDLHDMGSNSGQCGE